MSVPKQLSGAEFFSALGLQKGGIVSLVGAGGKTTTMFTLAELGKSLGLRVLVTTSTRILIPSKDQFDDIDLSGSASFSLNTPGIYVVGRSCENPLKMQGLQKSVFDKIVPYFDLILIEADGSKCKPLKGWKESEPVIFWHTTHTIGLLDLTALNKRIDENLVHRLSLFQALTGASEHDLFSVSHVQKIVEGEQGLFQHALGKKVVLCNKLENVETQQSFNDISHILTGEVYGGSMKQGIFYARS